jgi:hypothetical protein
MAFGRPPSPIAEALFNSLRMLRPGSVGRGASEAADDQLVLSYSDPHDFTFLWRLWDDERACGGEGAGGGDGFIRWARGGGVCKNLILVWDGVPSPSVLGGVALANYVTPYDWVVALGLTLFADHPTATTYPRLSVTIVDLISSGESQRLFRRVQGDDAPFMPWVRVYCPKSGVPGADGIDRLLVEHLRLPLRTASPAPRDGAALTANSDWELIRRVWSARLLVPTEPRDRHAIANLVGPQALLSSIKSPSASAADPSGPVCLHALLALMRALRLIQPGLKSAAAPWVGPDQWSPVRGHAETAVFLLDDMHALGWAEFLRLALGVNGSGSRRNFFVWGRPDARRFGPRGDVSLIDMLTDEEGRLRVGRGLNLRPEAAGAMLYLDLRLFSQRSKEEEFAFYERLLSLARQAEDDGSRADLPWRGFTDRELVSVAACVELGECEGDGYLVALTLLPRLVALVDPMLPVILFSSTGQRLVIETLRDYGSIITDFDKPRFFGGLKEEMAEETRGRFLDAFEKALRLLEGRRICQSFLTPHAAAPAAAVTQPYVEVYLDESEDVSNPRFRVGGLAIVFDGEGQAQRLNEEMVRAGLVWGSTDVEGVPAKCLPKQSWPAADFEKYIFRPVQNILGALGVPLAFGFSLSVPPDLKWTDSTDLTNPSCLDNVYRSLIVRILEALFYEVIPGKLGQHDPSFGCGVYLATRTRHESDADPPSAWDHRCRGNMTRRFGVKVKKSPRGSFYFNSVTSETAYPMVAQVRALQPEADIRVAYARGSQLIYGMNTSYPESLPRPAHLLADLVVRFSTNHAALGAQPTLRTWLKHGFSAVADESFESALRACRHARAGRKVEAIVEAFGSTSAGHSPGGVAAWALPHIARAAASLNGREFVSLCSRLR